jgi:hypothetical protein
MDSGGKGSLYESTITVPSNGQEGLEASKEEYQLVKLHIMITASNMSSPILRLESPHPFISGCNGFAEKFIRDTLKKPALVLLFRDH